jgi:pilus assembly protein CpaB
MVARRLITALLLALAVSGLFTFWIYRKVSKPQAVEAANLKYVAAGQQLDPGTLITENSLKLIDWPAGAPLAGAFTKLQDVKGRVLLYPVGAGEPVLEHDLSAAGAGMGLSAKIPDGMRAISLRSDEVVGVSGFLLPGTHVDVLVTTHPPSGIPLTSIVLQDVQILAAGQNTQPDPQGKATTTNVVTLLVSPEDAQKVTLASAQGTVQFVLRNGSDRQHVEDKFPQLAAPKPDALKAAVVAPAPKKLAEAPKPYVVQTMRGDKISEEKF